MWEKACSFRPLLLAESKALSDKTITYYEDIGIFPGPAARHRATEGAEVEFGRDRRLLHEAFQLPSHVLEVRMCWDRLRIRSSIRCVTCSRGLRIQTKRPIPLVSWPLRY